MTEGQVPHHCPAKDHSEVLALSREVFSCSYELAMDDEGAPVGRSQDASGGQPDISFEVLDASADRTENTLRNQRTSNVSVAGNAVCLIRFADVE
jgi:hypothetical protein